MPQDILLTFVEVIIVLSVAIPPIAAYLPGRIESGMFLLVLIPVTELTILLIGSLLMLSPKDPLSWIAGVTISLATLILIASYYLLGRMLWVIDARRAAELEISDPLITLTSEILSEIRSFRKEYKTTLEEE